jgi:hypothetical protein
MVGQEAKWKVGDTGYVKVQIVAGTNPPPIEGLVGNIVRVSNLMTAADVMAAEAKPDAGNTEDERGVWRDIVWHILDPNEDLSPAMARALTEQIVDAVMEQTRADREHITRLERQAAALRTVACWDAETDPLDMVHMAREALRP